jgi:hypothetical protein
MYVYRVFKHSKIRLILDQDSVTGIRGLLKRHERVPSNHLYNHRDYGEKIYSPDPMARAMELVSASAWTQMRTLEWVYL